MKSDKFKLRLVTWTVIGFGFFHLILGSYDYYPFIYWSMFSEKEHRPIKSRKTRTVVVAVDHQGREQVINLKSMAGTSSGNSGAAKTIENLHIQAMLDGDRELAYRIARQAEDTTGMPEISMLRLETWTWLIDGELFLSGKIPLVGDKLKPDRIRNLITFDTSARNSSP